MKPLLIVKVGTTVPALLERRGDFDAWIRDRLDEQAPPVQVVEPHEGQELPTVDRVGGVIVTGAASMITDEEAWSVRTEAWLSEALERECPILGICYGHQMLARISGGRVDWSANGREIGTTTVTMSQAAKADALFGDLPQELVVQTTHSQGVVEVPASVKLLASNEHERFQAIAVGDSAWGVQFHPEFDADMVRGYLEERREAITEEGIDVDERVRGTRDSEHGRELLTRFGRLVRARSDS